MSIENQPLTFISYSRVNKDFALNLAQELRSSGFNIFFDLMDIPTGARWDDVLERALDECKIFLVILTPSSSESPNVKDEIGYAIDRGKRILPILLIDTAVPLRLRRFQYVDFTDKGYEEGVESAKQHLRNLLTEFGPSEPEPAAAEQARLDSDVHAREEAEEQARVDAAEKAKEAAAEQARLDAEVRAREEAEKQAQVDTAERAKEIATIEPTGMAAPARNKALEKPGLPQKPLLIGVIGIVGVLVIVLILIVIGRDSRNPEVASAPEIVPAFEYGEWGGQGDIWTLAIDQLTVEVLNRLFYNGEPIPLTLTDPGELVVSLTYCASDEMLLSYSLDAVEFSFLVDEKEVAESAVFESVNEVIDRSSRGECIVKGIALDSWSPGDYSIYAEVKGEQVFGGEVWREGYGDSSVTFVVTVP